MEDWELPSDEEPQDAEPEPVTHLGEAITFSLDIEDGVLHLSILLSGFLQQPNTKKLCYAVFCYNSLR